MKVAIDLTAYLSTTVVIGFLCWRVWRRIKDGHQASAQWHLDNDWWIMPATVVMAALGVLYGVYYSDRWMVIISTVSLVLIVCATGLDLLRKRMYP